MLVKRYWLCFKKDISVPGFKTAFMNGFIGVMCFSPGPRTSGPITAGKATVLSARGFKLVLSVYEKCDFNDI